MELFPRYRRWKSKTKAKTDLTDGSSKETNKLHKYHSSDVMNRSIFEPNSTEIGAFGSVRKSKITEQVLFRKSNDRLNLLKNDTKEM